MRDQIAAAERAGLRAATVNSTNLDEWDAVLGDVRAGRLDVLLISPERLANPGFARAAARSAGRIGSARDRRGALRLGLGLRLPARLPAADPDAARPGAGHPGAGHHGDRQRAGDRRRRRPARRGHRHAARFAGSGLAAAGRGAGADACSSGTPGSPMRCASLPGSGHRLRAHGGRDRAGGGLPQRAGPRRGCVLRADARTGSELEDRLRDNQIKALVATSALGMGYDKPDLAFCVHLGSPASPVAYYQQVGRAGRALDDALAVLVPAEADERIWEYFATAGIPDEAQVERVLDALGTDQPQSLQAVEAATGIRRGRLETHAEDPGRRRRGAAACRAAGSRPARRGGSTSRSGPRCARCARRRRA